MAMATILFISPHLDDAVFSCAGAILKAAARGDRPVIATVFSHGSDHAKRREEDQHAAALLGAEAVWLGYLDVPDRSAAYCDFEAIIFGQAAEDVTLPAQVADSLNELITEFQPSVIYAPIAVGTHIDHRICFDAIAQVQTVAERRFYEDRPYSYAAGAAELRLHELGFRSALIHQGRLLAGFRRLPYVRAFLPVGDERRHCESLLLAPLNKPPVDDLPPSIITPYAAAETTAAHEAAAAYSSQFAAFCGSAADLRRRDSHHARRLGFRRPRAERYWTLPAHFPKTTIQDRFHSMLEPQNPRP